MRNSKLKLLFVFLPSVWIASSVNANHHPYNIECELMPGVTKCCTAIGGSSSPGELTFHWTDNTKGWYEQLITEDHYNNYHCNDNATGRPQLVYTVDNWPTLNAHGVADSLCNVM